jgi:cysteine desulfurase
LHSYGQKASGAFFGARQVIAGAIGAKYEEVIFTGSATEANNLALGGAMRRYVREAIKAKAKNPMPRLIISAIEHESVLKTAKDLARDGADVVIIPVSKEGVVDMQKLKGALNDRTALVSVMTANNETGVTQPIAEIAKVVREFRGGGAWPLMHTDAVQAFNYVKCDVNELGVDLMTLSAQKIYGPKGVGCLYVRSSKMGNFKTYPIDAVITGGGQEQGLRSGTENVAGAVGFAKAVELVEAMRVKESARLLKLRAACISGIKKTWPGAKLNGALKERLPNNINMYLPGKSAEEIIVALDLQGIAVSSGSACTARSPEPSHVLLAMGVSKEVAKNSVRITLGRQTEMRDITVLLAALKKLR